MDGLTLSEKFFIILFPKGKNNRELKEIERERHQEWKELIELNRDSYIEANTPKVSIGEVLSIFLYLFWMIISLLASLAIFGLIFLFIGIKLGQSMSKSVYNIDTFYETDREFIHESICRNKIKFRSWSKDEIGEIQVYIEKDTITLQLVLSNPGNQGMNNVDAETPVRLIWNLSNTPEITNAYEKALEKFAEAGYPTYTGKKSFIVRENLYYEKS